MKRVFLVSMVIFSLAFLWGCSIIKDGSKNSVDMLKLKPAAKQKINLYFTDKENSKIILETREVAIEDSKEITTVAVEELLKGPANIESTRAIPEGTTLLDIKTEGTVITVNLSKEYYKFGDINEVVARFTLVTTLCDLPDIDRVNILVEGKRLTDSSGKPLGSLSKDDVIFNSSENGKGKSTITLYFADEQWQNLIYENREILVKDNEPIEKYILQELIKGPKVKQRFATIPPQTKIISIETKEGICFVNLSNEFRTEHGGGSAGEIMTIYSIVNSLTELKEIDKVQFLIEGQKLESFKGHLIFNEPFEREESLINK